MRRRQSRKRRLKDRQSRKTILMLIGVCLILTVAIIAAFSMAVKRESDTAQTVEEEAPAASLPETVPSVSSEPPVVSLPDQTPTDVSTEAPTEAQTEAETEVETLPKYLENLSGIEPGTVLDSGKIDFANVDDYFMSWKIEEGDTFYQRINGKSYEENDHVPLSSLRYLKMPHYNFDGQVQVGEMIVGTDAAEDIQNIFKELFQAKYQINSMYLIDNYWTGDPDTTDYASIDVNNTSAFCFRQITGGGKLSNHAYGKAIDINPLQNPYVSYSSGSPKWAHSNANDYIDRTTGRSHVITHGDLAYEVFAKYGFRWGGDWKNPKDYQHFDKN